ncbi:hypothetical protein [Falsiroseomonas sp. CW058]|uniref:hypothetical protein n=1 Tax=Falsiroseomonas sp. CW058 TaxID=3388664 RepID=UPI003D3110B2
MARLYDWGMAGQRPYLPVIWPHCLVDTRVMRCERHRFATMECLLAYWAFQLFQAVEMQVLAEGWDDTLEAKDRSRQEVSEHTEMVRQIAQATGYGLSEAEVWVTRAVMAGQAIAAATLRDELPDVADYYSWYQP